MTSILTRRSMLRGLFATPAIVAASSLMPIRGIIYGMGEADVLVFPGNLLAIRDLLLPGLRCVVGQYSTWPTAWDNLFDGECRDIS